MFLFIETFFVKLYKTLPMTILLLDDHIMTLEGYASILEKEDTSFSKITNCEQLFYWITSGNIPDVALIDHDLPSFPEQKLLNGADCALLIRTYAPDCKIILITAHEESMVLYNMFRKVSPSALIVKADFTTEIIRTFVYGTSEELPFLSKIAQDALKTIKDKLTLIEPTNREILMYLAQGFKVSQIEDIVFMSKSGIQKRISKMLQEFGVNDHHELVQLVKKQNIL